MTTEAAHPPSDEIGRQLFVANPLPMWIYDLETLAFLEVNTAAVHHYGFNRGSPRRAAPPAARTHVRRARPG